MEHIVNSRLTWYYRYTTVLPSFKMDSLGIEQPLIISSINVIFVFIFVDLLQATTQHGNMVFYRICTELLSGVDYQCLCRIFYPTVFLEFILGTRTKYAGCCPMNTGENSKMMNKCIMRNSGCGLRSTIL